MLGLCTSSLGPNNIHLTTCYSRDHVVIQSPKSRTTPPPHHSASSALPYLATAMDANDVKLSTFSSTSSSSTSAKFDGEVYRIASTTGNPSLALSSSQFVPFPLPSNSLCHTKIICLRRRVGDIFYMCPNHFKVRIERIKIIFC